MCHMDRSRNSSQTRPGQSRPCCCCCCCCPQVSYLSIARTTTGEFSVFCAFLKWANLCDTLRQLIKLNKHEAEPRTDRERERDRERNISIANVAMEIETLPKRNKAGGKFHFHFSQRRATREIVKLLQELNVKLVIYFLNQRSAFCALS